jgi:hypothetical protein
MQQSFLRSSQYAQLVKKFLAFYGTKQFIALFTTAYRQPDNDNDDDNNNNG